MRGQRTTRWCVGLAVLLGAAGAQAADPEDGLTVTGIVRDAKGIPLANTEVLVGSVAAPVVTTVSAERVELRMRPATVVVGRVLSAAGKPVERFSLLQVGSIQGVSFPQTREVKTSNGRFSETVHALPDVLIIEAAGHAPLAVPTTGLPEGQVALGDLRLVGL